MKYLPTILYFLLPFCLLAQPPKAKKFIINGHINIDTGTIVLEMIRIKELYPHNFKNITVKIKDGKFNMIGETDYPIWCAFRTSNNYVSSATPIVSGTQSIVLNTDSNYQVPKNSNVIQQEEDRYNIFSIGATKKRALYHIRYDSLSKVYKGKLPEEIEFSLYKDMRAYFKKDDSTFLEYVKKNPNSYYAIYSLYNLINFGLNDDLKNAYEYFSEPLKNSRMGKALNQKILVAKTIAVGAQIPSFNVFNRDEKKVILNDYSHNKYTLVDLWYSHCAPCIAQFDKLKSIRKEFMDKGFEIIAISTDKEKYKPDWKEVILKHELPWPQFLDLNANEAHKLNIHIYPTNFLVDQTGKILVSNISPVELKYFLKEKLN